MADGEEFDSISKWVFSPQEAYAAGVEYAAQIQENKDRSLRFPVGKMDTYFSPVLPGQTVCIQAKSQNYKSGFIRVWEHDAARQLSAAGRENEVIVHVDTEHTLEELALTEVALASGIPLADISRGNVSKWDKVISAATTVNGIKIYRIANRLGEDHGPDLHLTNVRKAIKALATGKVTGSPVTIAAIFIDYLQALPIDPEVEQGTKNMDKQRRLQVRQDVYGIKRMAQKFKCPLVCGVQARQILTGTLGPTMLIPGLYDGEETSAIAQRFTRSIGLWLVKNDFAPGDILNHKGQSFPVTEDLLMIRVLKQQGNLPSGRWWACRVDHNANRITAL